MDLPVSSWWSKFPRVMAGLWVHVTAQGCHPPPRQPGIAAIWCLRSWLLSREELSDVFVFWLGRRDPITGGSRSDGRIVGPCCTSRVPPPHPRTNRAEKNQEIMLASHEFTYQRRLLFIWIAYSVVLVFRFSEARRPSSHIQRQVKMCRIDCLCHQGKCWKHVIIMNMIIKS